MAYQCEHNITDFTLVTVADDHHHMRDLRELLTTMHKPPISRIMYKYPISSDPPAIDTATIAIKDFSTSDLLYITIVCCILPTPDSVATWFRDNFKAVVNNANIDPTEAYVGTPDD
jgi:hypothetical protein